MCARYKEADSQIKETLATQNLVEGKSRSHQLIESKDYKVFNLNPIALYVIRLLILVIGVAARKELILNWHAFD